MSKRFGFIGGIRSGGLVCSIIGTIFASFYTVFIMAACGVGMYEALFWM